MEPNRDIRNHCDLRNRIHHAYVMQQTYNAPAASKTLVNAIFAAYQAADAVGIGIIKAAEIMTQYAQYKPRDAYLADTVCQVST